MTRASPYDLVIGGLDEARLDAIERESRELGEEPASPDELVQRTAAGEAVRELVGGSAGGAVREYGALLFHALHFRSAGRILFEVEESLLRALTEAGEVIGRRSLMPPVVAGYARMPERLLWAPVADDAPPEPVDGFFWSWIEASEGWRLELLLCLGLWPGRPGFSVVPVGASVPAEPGHWADAEGRSEGADFANVLPGGELDRLLSVTTPLEALKLASRLFHHIAKHPDAVETENESTRRVRLARDDG